MFDIQYSVPYSIKCSQPKTCGSVDIQYLIKFICLLAESPLLKSLMFNKRNIPPVAHNWNNEATISHPKQFCSISEDPFLSSGFSGYAVSPYMHFEVYQRQRHLFPSHLVYICPCTQSLHWIVCQNRIMYEYMRYQN